MDALEKLMILWFTPYQTTTPTKMDVLSKTSVQIILTAKLLMHLDLTLMVVWPILSLAGDSRAGRLVNMGRKPELSAHQQVKDYSIMLKNICAKIKVLNKCVKISVLKYLRKTNVSKYLC